MKLKILVGVLVFLIIINLATIGSFLFFQWRHGGPPNGRPNGPMRGLRLDPEKRNQMHSFFKSFHEETTALRDDIHKKERELIELMTSDTVDREAIDQQINILHQARAEMTRKAIDNLLNSKKILTQEEQGRFFNAILRARPGPRDRPGMRKPRFRGEQRPLFNRDNDN